MPVGAGRNRHCAGLCRSVPVAIGTVPVGAGRCRLVPTGADWCRPVPTGAGADRNRGEIARNAVSNENQISELKRLLIKSFKYLKTFFYTEIK